MNVVNSQQETLSNLNTPVVFILKIKEWGAVWSLVCDENISSFVLTQQNVEIS